VSNDPLLEDNVNNLYVASDNSGWVYNSTSLLYVTKPATAPTSNFNYVGTSISADGDKTADIERTGGISVEGLKYTMGIDVTSTDLDDLRTAGFYTGASLTNSPLGLTSDFFFITVERYVGDDTYVHQTATSFGYSGVANRVFSRVRKASVWQSWSELSPKSITVRKISTNTTLADSDNGTVILLTASCTVTLPNGLMSGFNCSFSTATGATLTYALGGSVTLINNVGTTMAQNLSHTIVNTGTSNEYLT